MFMRSRRPEPAPAPSRAVVEPLSRVYTVSRSGGHDALKREVHARLLEEADPALFATETLGPEATEWLRRLIQEVGSRRDELLTKSRLEQILGELVDEITGLGPLEPLMNDPSISEIMVNASDQIYVEQAGRILKTDVRFESDRHLLRAIDRIVSRVGRHIDEANPMCDARLPDGSRVNAIIPPLALNGPCLTIRRFAGTPLTIDDLIAAGAMTERMAEFLRRCVEARLNILVAGGTGTGKTTLLNVLSSFIPGAERLITIEDAAELQMQQPHVVRLETRQANIEGQGYVSASDLLRNSLRMRPDRIIIGEVRGGESLAMLQAMNTGHEGSMTTVHANTCRDALSRLETMVLMAGLDLPHRAIREQVVAALDLIVHVERDADGRRRVGSVCEVVGLEGEVYMLQEIFKLQPGLRADGGGVHQATGLVPRCLAKLARYGLEVPLATFQEGQP